MTTNGEVLKQSRDHNHAPFAGNMSSFPLKGVWLLSRDLFNFRKICDNISKTVRDSHVVLLNSNRKSYALYRMVVLPMTLGDP